MLPSWLVSYGKISESKSGLFLMTLFPGNQSRELVGYLDANPSPALRLNIDYLSELTKARSHYKLAVVSQCAQRYITFSKCSAADLMSERLQNYYGFREA